MKVTKVLRRCELVTLAVLALSGAALAQDSVVAPALTLSRPWSEPSAEPRAILPAALAAWSGTPGFGARNYELGANGEDLVALLAEEPPPVARETLEGSSEELVRYHGLPGGIVLGRVARGTSELAGARVEGDVEHGLALRLADGRVVRCPELAPDVLRACLAFTAQESDALVDIVAFDGAAPRLAPAFERSSLASLLVRMDGVPHRTWPETRAWKSVILDRDARCEVRGTELVLAADLEVRFYVDGGGTGWARRTRTVGALDAEFVGPRDALDLGQELAPLATVAGWLAFLRQLEQLDAAGMAALRSTDAAHR